MGGVKSAMGFGKMAPKVEHKSIFELSAINRDGAEVRFADLKGKVILISNVASK